MDCRHTAQLQVAGERVFTELKIVCVWNKGIGGQGSFYRSQHELVFVFKVGDGPASIILGWAQVVATAPMSGTMPELMASRPVAMMTLPSIRQSSRW